MPMSVILMIHMNMILLMTTAIVLIKLKIMILAMLEVMYGIVLARTVLIITIIVTHIMFVLR